MNIEKIILFSGVPSVTNYLSAPNLINTLHRHVGTSYRLYLPHIEDRSLLDGAWHATSCCANSAFRLVNYASLGAFGAAAAAARVAVGTLAMSEVSRAVGTALGWSAVDRAWTERQHSLDSILKYLRAGGEDCANKARVLSWPVSVTVDSERTRNLLRSSFVPLQKDLPGVHNLMDEEGMREAQVERMEGYKVETHSINSS